jgi:nucleoid DNA-binding protein
MKIYNNSTLNSVFTEEQIRLARFNAFSWNEKANEMLCQVDHIELEEFTEFKRKRVIDFTPSKKLLDKIKEACLNRLVLESVLRDLFHMIEANIAVFSSKNIEKAYKEYKERRDTSTSLIKLIMLDNNKSIEDNEVIENLEV